MPVAAKLGYFIDKYETMEEVMKKTVIAAMTAVALLSPSMSFAQQQTAPQADAKHERGGPSAADLKAFTDARIAGLKAGLQLTPDQEKNWPAVEQAIRDMAQARQERWAQRREHGRGEDAIARLRRRADAMTERAAQLKKLADAAEPLYQSLNDDQKHRLRFLVAMGDHHRFGGWHHRGHGRG
jgi:zinc resistance-associated protein